MALTEVVGRRGGMAFAEVVESPWVFGIRDLAAFGREGTCEPIGQHDAEETFGSKPSGAVLSENRTERGCTRGYRPEWHYIRCYGLGEG